MRNKILYMGLFSGGCLVLPMAFQGIALSNEPVSDTIEGGECSKQSVDTPEIESIDVPYHWSFSTTESVDLDTTELSAAPSPDDYISIPNVPWMRLKFGEVSLGEGSYIQIIGQEDGAQQKLTAETLAQSNYFSAYFNGDSVEVQVVVTTEDEVVDVTVENIIVGKIPSKKSFKVEGPGFDTPVTESICGADNRVASGERRVARIDPIGCTAWVIGNGKLLTAGHCLAGGARNRTISFNPPQSAPNGQVRFPSPQNQYTIDQRSFVFRDRGPGNDWGVFRVFNNSQTGRQPIDAQGTFRLRRSLSAQNIRVTGFGVDQGSSNQTNQTHLGRNTGSSGNILRYNADTEGGNSGSPVIDEATGAAIGIHTHGGCERGGNQGTSFFNSELVNAINQ